MRKQVLNCNVVRSFAAFDDSNFRKTFCSLEIFTFKSANVLMV
jgi:hypothetical protein